MSSGCFFQIPSLFTRDGKGSEKLREAQREEGPGSRSHKDIMALTSVDHLELLAPSALQNELVLL